jgi:hypothetical protein
VASSPRPGLPFVMALKPRRGVWAYGPDAHTPVDAARALAWDGPEDPGDWQPVTPGPPPQLQALIDSVAAGCGLHLHRIKVRRISGQPEHPQPGLGAGEGPQLGAQVHVEVVPHQHDVSAGQLPVRGDQQVPVPGPGERLRLVLAPAVGVQPVDQPAPVGGAGSRPARRPRRARCRCRGPG